jgi:NAD(P)-dependent dehydrogenase (short-subunit alcohol dehydrogenase family)
MATDRTRMNKEMYEKIFDLSGRTALVTGGSRGLGKSIARAYAEHGADIMICSRSENELEPAAREIASGLAVRLEWMTADLSQRGESQRVAEETLRRFGKVDVLVNNAGSNVPERVDQITDEAWDRILELNLSGIMRLTRALLPQMMQRKWGRVIHISSVLGLGGKLGRSTYSATKSALIGMTRSSALDVGPHGVTVNCIAPGPFLTELPLGILTAEQKEEFTNRTALKRWGRPEEIAGAALLLGSEAGCYITGATLLVDGGVLANTL